MKNQIKDDDDGDRNSDQPQKYALAHVEPPSLVESTTDRGDTGSAGTSGSSSMLSADTENVMTTHGAK